MPYVKRNPTLRGRVGRKAVGVLLALLAGTLTGVQSRSEHGGAMRPHTWWGRMGPGMKDDAGGVRVCWKSARVGG